MYRGNGKEVIERVVKIIDEIIKLGNTIEAYLVDILKKNC